MELNLNNPNLKQVIQEIQSRIVKDPITVQKQANWLEQELVNQNTLFGEDLAVIKDLEIKGLKELLSNQLEEEFINQIKKKKLN